MWCCNRIGQRAPVRICEGNIFDSACWNIGSNSGLCLMYLYSCTLEFCGAHLIGMRTWFHCKVPPEVVISFKKVYPEYV